MSDHERTKCSRQEYLSSVQEAVKRMQEEIYSALKEQYHDMVY